MFTELLEYIFHWGFSLYGLIFCICIVGICFIIFPKLRIPLIVYIIIIQLIEPGPKEIDFWTNVSKKISINTPYKKNVYKDTFKTVYHGTTKDNLMKPSFPSNKGKLLTFHPHGICCITYTMNRAYNETDLHDILLKAKVAVHSVLFKVPFVREISQIVGLIPASKENIKHYLDTGINVSIFPSGTKEGLYCKNDINDEYAYIKNRKGIFELLGDTYENVQIYTLGEQHLFLYDYKMPDIINNIMTKVVGKTTDSQVLNIFSTRNLYAWHKIWKGTSNKTITYIGDTVKYTGNVDKDREEYIKNLQTLFSNLCKEENIEKKLIVV